MPSVPLWTSILNMFNFRHERLWVWIAFAVVGGWVILINIMLMLAFTILRRETCPPWPNICVQGKLAWHDP